MESSRIEQLLDKYLNAETTLQEEEVLQDYFTSHSVAPHLTQYIALFGYFAKSKTERYTKTIQLNTQKKHWKWLSIAASVVILFSVYTGYSKLYPSSETSMSEAEIAEAKQALADTQKAFQMLSKNLNKGAAAIGYLENYETTTNKIFKNK